MLYKYRKQMDIAVAEAELYNFIAEWGEIAPATDKVAEAAETILYAYYHEKERSELLLDRYKNYADKYHDVNDGFFSLQAKIDKVDKAMECTLESDPRTFKNRECEYGWLFDRIHKWRKWLK